MLAKSMRGTEGKVTLPGIGALIGETYSWQLYTTGKDVYGLRAACNILDEGLWEEAGEHRRVELHIIRGKWYEAKPEPGAKVERKGKHFTIKPVKLLPL